VEAAGVESYDTPVKRVTDVLDDLVVAVLDIERAAIEKHMIEFGRDDLVHERRPRNGPKQGGSRHLVTYDPPRSPRFRFC